MDKTFTTASVVWLELWRVGPTVNFHNQTTKQIKHINYTPVGDGDLFMRERRST